MKAKHLLLILTSLFVSAIGFSQKAGTGKKDNLLFLLRQTEHINQALKTVEQLQSNTKTTLTPGNILIVVCGEAVTKLGTQEAGDWVKKIQKDLHVSIQACGLSLTKFNKSEKDLVPGIGYTENGFIKAFELQKEGYLSVEL